MASPLSLVSAIFVLAAMTFSPVHSLRHIVFIVADDLGWNDVGFHNPEMITPNIDGLATGGVILNSSYVQPVCTPSRHSFMTGVYPFKVGLQRGVIVPNKARCSPVDLKFFPEELKKLGYATHIVGKWHLGSCNWSCTPTYRGFDTFLGYYNGAEDYYTKVIQNGKDFRDGVAPAMDESYSTEIYAKRAVDIIKKHKKDTPLFLYMPFQAVHSPIQVPEKYEKLYANITDDGRRQYCGMVSAMDGAIGQVKAALQEEGLFDDTLIIFTADNGGMPRASGNNYPLRGAKSTVFEGGTRASAFVYGAGLEQTGYTYDGLIHAVDWHPTIVAAAGGETTADIDGVNQWDSIRTGGESKRTELIYNLDNDPLAQQGHAAIRVNNMKYIEGFPGPFQDWYKPAQIFRNDLSDYNDDENAYYQRMANETFSLKDSRVFTEGLFDLNSDPTELNDLSKRFPEIVKEMKAKLEAYRKLLVPPPDLPVDPASNPEHYGGYWSPGWC